jgi:hypothetical protein
MRAVEPRMLNARATGSIPASVSQNRVFSSVFSRVMLASVAWRHTGSGRVRARRGHRAGTRTDTQAPITGLT